jgi:hypothetical protein
MTTAPEDTMPEVLTVEEAASILRISRNSAYLLAQRWRDTDGREGLPVIELGRTLRVPRAALRRLLELPPGGPGQSAGGHNLGTKHRDTGRHGTELPGTAR